MSPAARQLIAQLQLEPLPREGGFFRVTHRNATASTILFLLTDDDFSAVHRIAQDEIWHFHAGDAVEHLQFADPGGSVIATRLGANLLAGDAPQILVAAGTWQAARLALGRASDRLVDERMENGRAKVPPHSNHGYALLGCTVSPPFEERGFQLLPRADALRRFPAHEDLLLALTR